MRFFLFVFFLSLITFKGFSQENSSDSVSSILKENTFESAELLRKNGNAAFGSGNYKVAVEYYESAIDVYRHLGDSIGLSKCHNNIGACYVYLKDWSNAISNLYKAVDINKALGEYSLLSSNYINLSNYYESQEEFAKAYPYLHLARQLLADQNNDAKLASVYSGLGNIFSNTHYANNDFDSSLFYLKKALHLYKKNEIKFSEARIDHNLGLLFERKGVNDSALVYYTRSLGLKRELKYEQGEIATLLGLGNIYRKQGNYGIAMEYLNPGIELAIKYGDKINYLNFLTNIIKCKIKLGEVAEADELFAEYNSLNDSIYDQEKARQLKELETIYETEKTGKELEAQIRQTREKTRQSYWFLGLAVGIGVFSGIVILFFIQRQRFNQKLRDQEIDRMRKEQEIKELNAMMQGQEEERNRIAEDLHDRLGARLSAIKLLSEQEKNGNSSHLTEMLEASIRETREISHNLSTDMLTRFGLANALRDLVNTVNSTNAIEGDFTTTNLEDRLPVEIERPLYHMISELVNNTIKHSKATSFFIQITYDDDEKILSLLYEDDGVGFDYDTVARKGMGMKNLRARVEGLHGDLTIDTSPGNGMHVMANIPLS